MNNNLLKSLIVVVIALGVTVLGVYGFRELTDKTPSPKDTTLAFYSQWVNYEGNPLVDRVYRDSEFLTSDFKNKVDDIINSFEIGGAYDPILCAQDIPSDIKVLDTSIEGDDAVVITEHFFSGGNKMVEVELVKNVDGWLINNIVCNPNGGLESETSESDKELVEDYIRENIASLSPEEEVLGGTFYVTSVRFVNAGTAIVDYEDGHIALTATATYAVNGGEVVINSFEVMTEKEANFSEIGNVVSTENGWDLVYEKPGQPALREVLIFSRESICTDETEDQSCFPNYWQNGDRVEVIGIMNASGVEVLTFRVVSDDDQRISGGELDREACIEGGGIIMFPDCVGCEPYCSYTEGEEVRETIKDEPESLCVDMCGNGTCEEIVCLGEGCPCAESPSTCPEDCK